MNRKLLIVLDGSALAEIVFPFAEELAARLSMDTVLLHVYSPLTAEFVPMYRAYVERTACRLQEKARAVQHSLGHKPDQLMTARGELVMGYHADEILKFADTNNIAMIMMASHGRSGTKLWSIGSVADKILRAAKVPVWMVHADMEESIPYDKWPTRTLLVPLSASEVSAVVLPHALEIAGQKGANFNVILMEVVETPATPAYYSPEITGVPLNWGQFVEQEMARSKKAAEEYLLGIEKQFHEKGIPVSSIVVTGKAAEEIISYSRKNPFTVIVMATHGRKGISRLVYGSVTEGVLFGVTNPIVVVRPQ
jgi:nucleotide-binding universal stress UspA family protein